MEHLLDHPEVLSERQNPSPDSFLMAIPIKVKYIQFLPLMSNEGSNSPGARQNPWISGRVLDHETNHIHRNSFPL